MKNELKPKDILTELIPVVLGIGLGIFTLIWLFAFIFL